MKLKKISTIAEIEAAADAPTADRPRIEITTGDNAIRSVRIGRLHISMESYTFRVEHEVEHDTAKRWRVTAKVKGFPDAVSYFEESSDANRKVESYDPLLIDVNGPAYVDVLLNSAGEIVGEAGEGNKPVDHNGDNLPF